MRSIPFGYKIMFTFDMPDGRKNGGITSKANALYMIWKIYTSHSGTNLVIRDETIYKDIDELPEETKPSEWSTEA